MSFPWLGMILPMIVGAAAIANGALLHGLGLAERRPFRMPNHPQEPMDKLPTATLIAKLPKWAQKTIGALETALANRNAAYIDLQAKTEDEIRRLEAARNKLLDEGIELRNGLPGEIAIRRNTTPSVRNLERFVAKVRVPVAIIDLATANHAKFHTVVGLGATPSEALADLERALGQEILAGKAIREGK